MNLTSARKKDWSDVATVRRGKDRSTLGRRKYRSADQPVSRSLISGVLSVVLRNGCVNDVFDTLFPFYSVARFMRARLDSILISLQCCSEM